MVRHRLTLIAFSLLVVSLLLPGAAPLPAQESRSGVVVEEIVARVNNEIITRGQLERARRTLVQEIEQECPNCTPQEKDERLREREKNLLRDLIDHSLLVQRAQEIGISVDTDVIRQLDEIRRRNNLESMEALAASYEESTGQPFEDFRGRIRDQLLTQRVIRSEVVREIVVGREDVQKYYEEHKEEFYRPEMVYLSEIFLSTEGKSEEEIAAVEEKARQLLTQCREGGNFPELARRNSDGSTAERGGELGGFERGQLAKEIEDTVFQMKRGDVTDVIRTQTGFLILRVDERFEAGLQPVEKVEGEIMNRIYNERVPDRMRGYLDRLREQNYVYVKPGYMDVAGGTSLLIEEVQPQQEPAEEEKKKSFLRKLWPFGAGK